MRELNQRANLSGETGLELGLAKHERVGYLDHYVCSQVLVVSSIHGSHAAFAQFLVYRVTAPRKPYANPILACRHVELPRRATGRYHPVQGIFGFLIFVVGGCFGH